MKDCFWVVYNKREGAIKSFKPKEEAKARTWQRRHRPRGTRLIFMCIPGRD